MESNTATRAPSGAKLFQFFRRHRTRAIRLSVLALLAVLSSEILLSSRQESQVSDEADHIYAGYEYWKHADFGHNPEHPPLAKLVAASALLPLTLEEPNVPYSSFKSGDFYNGASFLYAANADSLLARGRAMLLLFALGLGLAVFAAGSEMFSPEAGLLALGLFTFEPILIGNAGLILTDTALTCTMFLSVYTFYRYWKCPGLLRLSLCAMSTGLALAAKHSAVLIFPILATVAIAEILSERNSSQHAAPAQPPRRHSPVPSSGKTGAALLPTAVTFAVLLAAGYAILWAFYGFRYAARPNGLAMAPSLITYALQVPNRFAATAIIFCARHHLLPEAYLFGWADILKVPGSRFSFILGKLRKGSWPLSFPLVILIKTTLPLLILLLLGPSYGTWRQRREFRFLAIPPLAYLVLAIVSQMNGELRYVLPIYPFLIVLAGAAAWQIARRSKPGAVAIACLFLFDTFSSVHSFPDYLAYSNELFGGPSHSYRLLAGTNGDSGQGLKWVKSYLDANPTADCWFDYVDPFVTPAYYGIPCKLLPSQSSLRGGTPPIPIPPEISGTILISATEAAARTWEPESLDPYASFRNLSPDATPGNIVLVYHGVFRVDLLAAYSHSLAANALLGQGRTSEALVEAKQAANLAPTSANMQAALGLALMAAGQVDQGKQVNANALRLAYAVHPESQLPLIHLLGSPGMTPSDSHNSSPSAYTH